MAKAAKQNTTPRVDVVFIRKSSEQQDEKGQIGNVRTMLDDQKFVVAKENWFQGVPRHGEPT